jgi:hypothetical protein
VCAVAGNGGAKWVSADRRLGVATASHDAGGTGCALLDTELPTMGHEFALSAITVAELILGKLAVSRALRAASSCDPSARTNSGSTDPSRIFDFGL